MPLVAGLPTRLPGTATPIFSPPFPGGIPSPQPSTAAAAVPPAGFPRLTSAPHLKHALSPPPFKVIPGGGDPGARTYSGTGNLSGRGFGKLSKKEMAPGPAKANKESDSPRMSPGLGDTLRSGGLGDTFRSGLLGETLRSHRGDIDLGASANDETVGTVNSLHEFLAEVAEGADATDPDGLRAIENLRRELTDRGIRTKLLRMPVNLCESVLAVLERQNDLLMELLQKERGGIIAPLVEKLGAEACFTIIRYVLDHFTELATCQGGCIALPRIMAHLKPSQLQVFFQTAREQVKVLWTHPYGNFVIKHFLTEPTMCAELVGNELRDGDNLRLWSMNKHGSQLVDELFRHADGDTLKKLVEFMFAEDSLIVALSFDRFGNYNVQSAFKALNRSIGDVDLRQRCVQRAAPLVRDSPYAQNIMKHAVDAATPPPARSGPRPVASPSPPVASDAQRAAALQMQANAFALALANAGGASPGLFGVSPFLPGRFSPGA